MTDYFAYNGEDVIPTYMPGVPSYGQEGSEGNTGDVGPSVYYTSYSLPSDIIECNLKISQNKLLSNNINKDSYNEYMEGDLVIDSLGNIYKIESINGTLMIPVDADVHDSTNLGGEVFTDFKCKISTSFIRNSSNSPKITNRNFDNSGPKSYKLYHSRNFQKEIYGNWISFSIKAMTAAQNTFVYYYNLVLPNGECLRTISSSSHAKMFVDNRYLYGCYGCAETSIANDSYAKKVFGLDIFNKIGYSSINDLIKYNSFFDNDEKNIYATILVSYYIHKYCTAYVEIHNKTNGKIYRYDLTEILPASVNTDVDSDNTEYIDPFTSQISWDYSADSSYNTIIPKPSKPEETEESITYYRTFKNYISCASRANGDEDNPENEYISGAYYNFIQDFFFVDKDGFTVPEMYDRPDDDLSLEECYKKEIERIYNPTEDVDSTTTPLYVWLSNNVQEKTSTMKIKFSGINRFSLNIRFNPFISHTGESMMPYTMIYIGYPNLHLWQEANMPGDNVRLPNSSLIKQDTDGEIHYDGSAGVYYIYKIIPYGLALNDGTDTASVADAGFSIVSIDLTQFDLDLTEENWIEVGAMMFGNNSNEEHRPSIFPMSGYRENINNGRDNVCSATPGDAASSDNTAPDGIGHYQLGGIWPNVCYSFADVDTLGSDVLNTQRFVEGKVEGNGTLSSENKPSNPLFDAGRSDVTMYLNNIVELSFESSDDSDTEIINSTALEQEQYIDYEKNGLKWDSLTYTVKKQNTGE